MDMEGERDLDAAELTLQRLDAIVTRGREVRLIPHHSGGYCPAYYALEAQAQAVVADIAGSRQQTRSWPRRSASRQLSANRDTSFTVPLRLGVEPDQRRQRAPDDMEDLHRPRHGPDGANLACFYATADAEAAPSPRRRSLQ